MEDKLGDTRNVNLTIAKKLVYEIPQGDWITTTLNKGKFANIPIRVPVGIPGHEVVIYQKLGEDRIGKFISCLQQGDTLSDADIEEYSEFDRSKGVLKTLFRKDVRLNVIAYAVSTETEIEEIEEQFAIRPYEITVNIWLKYKITDTIKVANNLRRDPLRRLCEEVVSVLNEKIPQHDHRTLTVTSIKNYIESIGNIEDLGMEILQASAKYQLPQELGEHMKTAELGRMQTINAGETRYIESVINSMINDLQDKRSIIIPAIQKYIDGYTDGELEPEEFKKLISSIPEMGSLKQYFESQNPEEIISVFKQMISGKPISPSPAKKELESGDPLE